MTSKELLTRMLFAQIEASKQHSMKGQQLRMRGLIFPSPNSPMFAVPNLNLKFKA